MKKHYLPTYEEAVEITQKNECFYEKQVIVNDTKVSVFNYRLAQFKDFDRPIEGSNLEAYELRGLTFIHDKNGIRRHLMLHKFFNLNQVPGYQYDEVKDFEVTRVQDKLDGSMIRFLIINGQLVAKTKMDFTNDQCKMAMEVVNNNSNIKEFVLETLNNEKVAIFEMVSIFNQIVIKYDKTDLVLLQLRDEKTGNYENIYDNELVKKYNINCSKIEEPESLSSYVERSEKEENIEGWVITLKDSNNNTMMLKKKTKWYCELHGLLSENLVRENKILNLILTDTLDDAMAQVDETDLRRKYAEKIQSEVIHYLDKQSHAIFELYKTYTGDRKEFALKNLKNEHFPIATKLIGKDDFEAKDIAYNLLKLKVMKDTNGLMDAKHFVENTLKISVQNLDKSFEDE